MGVPKSPPGGSQRPQQPPCSNSSTSCRARSLPRCKAGKWCQYGTARYSPGANKPLSTQSAPAAPGAARALRPGGLNAARGAGASADTPSLSAERAEQPHPQHCRGPVQPKYKEIRPRSQTCELWQHQRAPGPCSHPGQGASTAGVTCPARRVLNGGCQSVPRHQGRTSSPSLSPGPPQQLRILGAQEGAENWCCLH